MSNVDCIGWWKSKGAKIINAVAVNLAGQHIGFIPLQNLFTKEQLDEIGEDNLPVLWETMRDDGMKVEEYLYSDGSHELRFFID